MRSLKAYRLPRLCPRTMCANSCESTIAKLVSFGTRHTLSDAESPTRGIGAARSETAQRRLQLGFANRMHRA